MLGSRGRKEDLGRDNVLESMSWPQRATKGTHALHRVKGCAWGSRCAAWRAWMWHPSALWHPCQHSAAPCQPCWCQTHGLHAQSCWEGDCWVKEAGFSQVSRENDSGALFVSCRGAAAIPISSRPAQRQEVAATSVLGAFPREPGHISSSMKTKTSSTVSFPSCAAPLPLPAPPPHAKQFKQV